MFYMFEKSKNAGYFQSFPAVDVEIETKNQKKSKTQIYFYKKILHPSHLTKFR